MGDEKGIYIVRVEDCGDAPRRVITRRFEETDEDIDNLAMRLEALVEEGWIDSYEIVGQALPPYETPSGLYTAIIEGFWHASESKTILGEDAKEFARAWEQSWRNRDYYFTRNARRNIR